MMDDYIRRRAETRFRQLVYPAVLTPAVLRLLVVKLYEIEQQRLNQRRVLDSRRALVSMTHEIASLPKNQQAKIREFAAARDRYRDLEKEMNDLGITHVLDNTVDIRMPEHERRAWQQAQDAKYKTIEDDAIGLRDQLDAIAFELAGEQIAAVRANVPDSLIKRLDGINAPALPAAKEEV